MRSSFDAARTTSFILAFTLLSAVILATSRPSFGRDPLIMPGKQTLFQRILTRPDAPLSSEAGSDQVLEVFPPFEIFYVYGEKEINGTPYIEVGRSLEAGPEGWLPKDRTIEWKQAVVLGFNNPANRNRALIFKTKEDFMETVAQEDVQARLDQLREDATANQLQEGSPIVSIEPAEYINIENEFYLLPIIDFEQIRLPSHIPARILRIASVPKQSGQPIALSKEEALRNFRIGVTFVIDTTKSMKPYIAEVRRAVGQLRDRVAGNPEAERFRFGLVVFRDNTDLVPELGYVKQIVLPLSEASTADEFLAAIDTIDVAGVNSHGFNEDSVAGVVAAANEMDWQPFGGRYVILITDAGPRPPGDEAGAGDLAAPQLQELLKRKGIALFALHLKTNAGQFDHHYAEEAYRAMSRFDSGPLYFPIERGDANLFGQAIDELANDLGELVSDAVEGRIREANQDAQRSIGNSASEVGRAMALAYLGTVGGTQAPDVFDGWLTDRDPLSATEFPVTPYVLMSRNELSTLSDMIERTIELGIGGAQNPDSEGDFFNQLRAIAAVVHVNPASAQNAGNLGDLMGEYLSDLPYRSEITVITPQDWREFGPIRQRQLLDTLKSKLNALGQIYRDTTRWFAIKPDAPDGEYVTTVPLRLMP